ncbi:MAG: hypothetical protein QXK80_00055 [Candidatus Pacearchaeota archaeon]
MKIKFRYPKLTLIGAIIISAYFIFSNHSVKILLSQLNSFSYFGAFIAGLFYTYGFTGPLAAGFFIDLNPNNILLAGILGGFGALVSDLLIFDITRFTLIDEFNLLKKTKFVVGVSNSIEKIFGKQVKVMLAYLLAGVFIASPLPDEAGVIMIAGLTKIKQSVFITISFVLNTIGILLLLSL